MTILVIIIIIILHIVNKYREIISIGIGTYVFLSIFL